MNHTRSDVPKNAHPEPPALPTDVVAIRTEDGEHLLYEEEHPTAWISADNAIPIGEVP